MLLFSLFVYINLFLFSIRAAFAEDIRDIKPPIYFKTSYSFLVIIAIIILLAALIFLLVFILRKLRKKSRESHVIKPAHQIAYEALRALRAKNLPSQGKIKEHYYELSDITRRYIEDRFSVRAPDMTTEEFLFRLKNSSILTGTQNNLVEEFLGLCDIVKFAKYGPTRKEIDESFDAAKRLVDETKIIEEDIEKVPEK